LSSSEGTDAGSSEEVILIVAEGCPHCEEAKKLVKDSKVRVLDVTKDERAAAILRDLEEYRVPLLVTLEKAERGAKLCAIDEKGMKVKCVDASPESLGDRRS
jgi:glutaredoxin